MDEEKSAYGYGKKPLWQWVLLYVVVGGVIYALIYYFWFAGQGYNYSPASSQPTQTQTNQTPQSTPSASPGSGTHATGVKTTGTNPPSTPTPQSFTVNANDTSASVETITVPSGTSVTITFGVDGSKSSHGGLDFRSSVINTGIIAPGGTKTITFTAAKSFSLIPYWANTNTIAPYKIDIVVK